MTQSDTATTTATAGHDDVLNTLLHIEDGSPLAELRAQRPEAMEHAQGSYDALFIAPPATPLSPAERFATALRVVQLHVEPALVEHYRARLPGAEDGSDELVAAVLAGPDAPGLSERPRAILAHVELLVLRPAAATPADLHKLQAAGLTDAAIVTLSQIIAYVSFQVRVLVGLALLRGDERPASTLQVGPNDAPDTGFTQEQLGWVPWLTPVAVADVTDEQRAVLPGRRLDSPYFRLLALDPAVLGERTATDNGIFYTHGGAPRADRELSAAATSRVNGCIYCASVHSRLASQLSKRPDDVQRLLDEGVGTELDPRWRAVVDLAAALTVTPPATTRAHLDRLRDLGLADLEILDLVQAVSFFAWANRLMLTLGEPAPADA